jgi:ubiquinone/menaquinone biosynthesis C-methylase UbiE
MEQTETVWARQAAVSAHHQGAVQLDQAYQIQTTAGSALAFRYGRAQIDIHFNREIAALPLSAKILDVGCGPGLYMKRLRGQGFEVIGVEPAENMRNIARSRLPHGTVREASAHDLPFENEAFDFVYEIEVFRYLAHEDNLRALREAFRVLKPGGTFFGTFANRFAMDGFQILEGLRSLRQKWTHQARRWHTEFETPKSVERLLHSAGFSLVETHGAMFASMQIACRLGPIGRYVARAVEPADPVLSDVPLLRCFAGHLIGVARKQV